MKTLQWKEPPPAPRAARSETQEVLAQLKANPGRWALLVEDAKSQSAASTWKKHGCETTTRRNEKNMKHFDVYVRWPKPPVTASTPATATKPGPRPAPAVSKPTTPLAAPSAEPSAPSGDPGLDSYMAKRRQRTGRLAVNGL